jgi:parvulin-like peptidyl-prolyl isomerase
MKCLTGLLALVCLTAALPEAYGQAAATVNGQSVPLELYYRRMEISPAEPAQVYPPPVAQQTGFSVLNKLIAEMLLLQLAEKEGVPPTEQQINERIALLEENLKQRDMDLKTLLNGAGVSEAEFRESLKPEIAQTNVYSKYITISEEEMRISYDEATAGLPEDQRHRSAFYLPEAVFLQTVIAETREKAEEARRHLLNGMPFPEVAKQYSVDPISRERGGDVGWLNRPDPVRTAIPGIPPEVYEKAFSTKTGEISEPFQTGGRWVLLKVRERREARFQPFETVKPLIRDRLLRARAADHPQVRELLEKARTEAKVEVNIPAYRERVVITAPAVPTQPPGPAGQPEQPSSP